MDFGVFGNSTEPDLSNFKNCAVQVKNCQCRDDYTLLTLWDGSKSVDVRFIPTKAVLDAEALTFALVTFSSVVQLSDRTVVRNISIVETPEEMNFELRSLPKSFKYRAARSPSTDQIHEDEQFTDVSSLRSGNYSCIRLVLISLKKPYQATSGTTIVYFVAGDATGSVNGAVFNHNIPELKISEFEPGQYLEFRQVQVKPNDSKYQRWATLPLQLKFSSTSSIAKLDILPQLPRITDMTTYITCKNNPADTGFLAMVVKLKHGPNKVTVTLLDSTVHEPVSISIPLPMAEAFHTIYHKKICLFMNIDVTSQELTAKNQKTIMWIDKGSPSAIRVAKELVDMQYADLSDFPFLSSICSSSSKSDSESPSPPVKRTGDKKSKATKKRK